jgi:hypothetical protein
VVDFELASVPVGILSWTIYICIFSSGYCIASRSLEPQILGAAEWMS